MPELLPAPAAANALSSGQGGVFIGALLCAANVPLKGNQHTCLAFSQRRPVSSGRGASPLVRCRAVNEPLEWGMQLQKLKELCRGTLSSGQRGVFIGAHLPLRTPLP